MERTATPQPRIRRRIISLLLVTSVAVVGALGVRWWQIEDPAWACGPSDDASGCVSQVELDPSDLPGFRDGKTAIGFESFALSVDGTEVVAGLHTVGDQRDVEPERAWVGVFDTATGELVRVLYDTGPQYSAAHLEGLALSPDGSILALESYVSGVSSVQILDADDGDARTLLGGEDSESVDCNRLGFSDDNTLLQCDGSIWSVADGTLIETLQNENRYADSAGSGFAWSRSGRSADAYVLGLDGLEVSTSTPAATWDVDYQIEWPDDGFDDMSHLGFDPTERFLIEERSTSQWSFWSSFAFWSDSSAPTGPRRSHPDATLTAYDADDGSVQMNIDLARRHLEWSWSSDGTRFAAVGRDLTLSVFATEAWAIS